MERANDKLDVDDAPTIQKKPQKTRIKKRQRERDSQKEEESERKKKERSNSLYLTTCNLYTSDCRVLLNSHCFNMLYVYMLYENDSAIEYSHMTNYGTEF